MKVLGWFFEAAQKYVYQFFVSFIVYLVYFLDDWLRFWLLWV